MASDGNGNHNSITPNHHTWMCVPVRKWETTRWYVTICNPVFCQFSIVFPLEYPKFFKLRRKNNRSLPTRCASGIIQDVHVFPDGTMIRMEFDQKWQILIWLVVYLPLWKMMEFVNWKDDIPYMKWKIKHVPNHQPVMILMTHISNIWIGYDRIILMGCPQEKTWTSISHFLNVHPCHSLVEPFNSRQVKHWRKCWQSVLTKAWGHKASLVRFLGCTTISHSTDQTCHSSSS